MPHSSGTAEKATKLQSHWKTLITYLMPLTNSGRDTMATIFPDDIFKCIFLNENVWISIEISLNFVPMGPINNISAMVQIMAWCRPGDKPLSEPMMVSLLAHICVTRPKWVNTLQDITLDVLIGPQVSYGCHYIEITFCLELYCHTRTEQFLKNKQSESCR